MAYLGWFDGELRPDGWFDAELQRAAWFDTELVETSSAVGTQTLAPNLFANSPTFFAPALTTGAVTLSPARVDGAAVFYGPTLAAGAVDANFSSVSLLLKNTLTDSSNYAHTVAASGGAAVTTADVKYGAGAFNFPASSNLTVPSNAAFALGTGDFTIESWVKIDAWSFTFADFAALINIGNYVTGLQVRLQPESIQFYSGADGFLAGTAPFVLGQWVHLAFTRQSGTVRFWRDGVQQGSNYTSTSSISAGQVMLGMAADNASEYLVGKLDDVRFTTGVARYSATFTPPTVELWSSAAGTVTLTPARVNGVQVFYSPTVTAAGVNLLPTRLDNAQTFFTATIATGAVNLAPSRVTNTSVVYPPALAVGAVTLSPTRLDNTAAFYAATVAQTGPLQTLSPTRLDNASALYAPTVSTGGVVLTAPLLTNTSVFYGPAVTPGAVSLQPTRYDGAQTFYAATLAVGPVSLLPARLDNSNTIYAAALSLGVVTLTASRYDNLSTFFAATLTKGPVTLTPGLVSNSSTVYSPAVSVGPVTLTAARYDNAQTFYSSSITTGSISLTATRLDNAQTFYSATLVAGPAQLSPTRIDNVSSVFAPAVSVGTTLLQPGLLTNANTFYAAAVIPVTQLTAPLITNSPQFFAVTVTPGTVTLAPALATNTQSFYAPAVAKDSFTISLAQANLLYQVYLLHGLAPGVPLTVSQTQRMAGGITQAITESGGSVTITTVSATTSPTVEAGDMITELAALHGLTTALVVNGTQRTAGSVAQSITTSGTTTTVTRQ